MHLDVLVEGLTVLIFLFYSYGRLCEVVDHVFPLLIRGNTTDFPCSDTFSQFTFWREQLPEVEKQEKHSESS